MDIKLKSNKKTRMMIAAVILAGLALINVCCFPAMNRKAEKAFEIAQSENRELNFDLLRALYQGTQLLYYEQRVQGENAGLSPRDVFVNEAELEEDSRSWVEDTFDSVYDNYEQNFNDYRYGMNYYATNGTLESQNTDKNLEGVLDSASKATAVEELKTYFSSLWIMKFDTYGRMHIEVLHSEDVPADVLIKALQSIAEEFSVTNVLEENFNVENARGAAKEVKDFTVVYGIAEDADPGLVRKEEGFDRWQYSYQVREDAIPLFFVMTVLVTALAVVLTSPKIWKDITSVNRKGNWYVLEFAACGVFFLLAGGFFNAYIDGIYEVYKIGLTSILQFGTEFNWGMLAAFFEAWVQTIVIFGIIFLAAAALSPALTLGVKEYIRQYSFFYQIFPNMKKWWKAFKAEVSHVNFSEKSTKTIFKVVAVNFVVITFLTCFWFVGTLGVVIYSVILFLVLVNYYDRISKNYKVLEAAINRIAKGDLDTDLTEDIGVFEPMKEELSKIRTGFKKAVEEEIKSQRMKTELITNVSHDLKTPLTAITTYVELLKKDGITEEERREYIETLERKALRLKVLIEDLFEVSKANSKDMTLNLVKVDLVKLLKQVSVEHTEKLEKQGMELRWTVPEEKTELMLDSQKTYRIFENLFVNLQKYAMPNSRIYIEVTSRADEVVVVLKNMSAAPLNVAPEELTERFVRGDASRNTEGSGLGLAIAKSFTEAQKGRFEVTVDGDLFKTTLSWKKG